MGDNCSNMLNPKIKENSHLLVNKIFSKIESQAVGAQYAQALLDIAKSSEALEDIHSDLDILGASMKEENGLCDLMVNPLIPAEKKINLIDQISVKGSFNTVTTNFLKLLVDKGRIDCITEVFEAFEALYCQATNTQVAMVKSAVVLEEEEQFLIAKKIKELSQSKSVKIKPLIDESLIGGFVVEYGSNQIDLSVRGALERVKKELTNVVVLIVSCAVNMYLNISLLL